jgi:hypothetical protein
MQNASVSKALIMRLDKNDNPVEPGIVCKFNPKEYTLTKQNQWNPSKATGSNVPELEFSNGQPATLQMELLFDTLAERKDVREQYTNALWNLMMVDASLKPQGQDDKPWPPRVRFQWGKTLEFKAVVTNMTQKFTLFLVDGTPVRALVNITLKQIVDQKQLPKQNPTSGGGGGEQFWTVSIGDTLMSIAYKVYGDPNRWRQIADSNRLTQVRRLVPGSFLKIPGG